MHSAYFDRLSPDNRAVLLVDSLEKEFLLSPSLLPAGSKPGTWFLVTIQEEAITAIQMDGDKTNQMKKEIENRLSRLKSNKRSRFKRN